MIRVQLIVVQGKPEGKTIPLSGPVFRIGRNETCHLRPNSELISREHTEITIREDAVVVRDLGSRNGTFINGKQLKGEHQLKNGELLQVGPLTFAVSIQGAPAAVAAPAKPPAAAAAAAAQATSLDDVPPAQIDSWLVADQANPTPDRPSGVYDGDTLTIAAYNEGKDADKRAPAPAKAEPAPTPPKAAPAASAPSPAPPKATTGRTSLEDMEFEQLPEGEGDMEETVERHGEGEEAAAEIPEEFMDESNPFYAAKKAAEQVTGPAKQQYKDSSDAASDILKRMMERRRARS
jgi:predicted component of type VI protein secretion system